MNQINLLPALRRQRIACRRLARRWVTVGVGWCCLLVAFHLVASGIRGVPDDAPLRRDAEELRASKERLVTDIRKMDASIDRDHRALVAARSTIDHPDWSVLLARIVAARDATIEFRRWQLARGERGATVLRIEGDVPQLAPLTEFVLRLERLEVFQRVALTNAKASADGGQLGFTIDATLVAPKAVAAAGKGES